MEYTNRICHLLNDGIHVAPAAILYHADAEWSGEYMYFQKPTKLLAQNAINYDILPADVFVKRDNFNTSIHGNKLAVNGEEYSSLIIPYSQYITASTAKFIAEANKGGFTTIFINKLPKGICDEKDSGLAKELIDNIKDCQAVTLEDLVSLLQSKGLYEIRLSENQPYLRYYHYSKEGTD